MKNLCLSLIAVHLLASGLLAAGEVVHSLDEDWIDPAASGWELSGWATKPFETEDPAGNHAFVDVSSEFGLTGQWLFAEEQSGLSFSATRTISDVPMFDNVSINQLVLGAGGGIDANQMDGVALSINGTEIFNANLHGRNDGGPNWESSYGGTAPETILSPVATDDTNGGEFFSERTNGWGHDTLYDAGLDPNLKDIPISGAGDVTIVVSGRLTDGSGGMENNPDEQVGVANLSIDFSVVPEPSSLALIFSGLGMILLFRRRRQ